MPLYRKKPIVIEAIELTDSNMDTLKKWTGGEIGPDVFGIYVLIISTLEGNMIAETGDYIIKGIEGEFYPCKASIFEQTYELVTKE